jgi:hypothetical protein
MHMRTTLTLEDDVAGRLRAEMHRSGKSMNELVNEYLRAGLNAKQLPPAAKRFKVHPAAMGSVPGLNYDNIGELLEHLEGPLHR